jgi:hypothetical protein
LHERRSGLPQYGATTLAAESVIAQLDSQGKLTTPRRENRKIRHENEISKANEQALYVWELQIYRLIPKKHICKSRETIPLTHLNKLTTLQYQYTRIRSAFFQKS